MEAPSTCDDSRRNVDKWPGLNAQQGAERCSGHYGLHTRFITGAWLPAQSDLAATSTPYRTLCSCSTRSEIRHLLFLWNLPSWPDSSNQIVAICRNRIRRQLSNETTEGGAHGKLSTRCAAHHTFAFVFPETVHCADCPCCSQGSALCLRRTLLYFDGPSFVQSRLPLVS